MANQLLKGVLMNPLTIKAKQKCDISARNKRNDTGTAKAYFIVMGVLILISSVVGAL